MTGSEIDRRKAFTLIELLVVITIISILSGMLSIIIGIAQRKAKQTSTRAILMKVDQAIRLFRNETGTYPFQTDYSNADADPTQWTNNLAFRLAWKPVDSSDRTTYLAAMQTDLAIIHRKFFFKNGKNVPPTGDCSEGTHAFRFGQYYFNPIDPNFKTNLLLNEGSLSLTDDKFTIPDNGAANYMIPGWSSAGAGTCAVLSRMADEISTLRYLSGQIPVEAPQGLDPWLAADRLLRPNLDPRYTILHFGPYTSYHYVPYNKRGWYADDSRGPVLTSAAAAAQGWRSEYLGDTLRKQTSPNSPGEIDPTGNVILDSYGHPLIYICTFTPGSRGYAYALGGVAVDEGNYGMTPRSRLATDSMTSDVRTTAASTYAMEFELWSAGPDGKFRSNRADRENHDNISLFPYNKDLQ